MIKNYFPDSCGFGYSYVCNSSYTSGERSSICATKNVDIFESLNLRLNQSQRHLNRSKKFLYI